MGNIGVEILNQRVTLSTLSIPVYLVSSTLLYPTLEFRSVHDMSDVRSLVRSSLSLSRLLKFWSMSNGINMGSSETNGKFKVNGEVGKIY